MFLHVSYTWMITNVINFFLSMTIAGISAYSVNHSTAEVGFYFAIVYTIVCLAFSLPCLLVAGLFLNCIALSNYTASAKFFMWLLTIPALILLEYWLIEWRLLSSFDVKCYELIIPCMISAIASILIRYHQFKKLVLSALPDQQGMETIQNNIE